MNIPRTIPVREGHKEKLDELLLNTVKIAKGPLGWSGMARMFVDLGLDKTFLKKRGKRLPNKRIRVKMTKAVLKQTFLQQIASHLDCSKAEW